jgi:hypothetical protein
MTAMMTDLRDGARVLLRSPGFAARGRADAGARHRRQHHGVQLAQRRAAVAPSGAQDPNHIVQWARPSRATSTRRSRTSTTSIASLDGFAGMAARSERPLTLSVPQATGVDGTRTTSAPDAVWCELVSDNFFPLLGVQPVVGRTFLPSECGDPAMRR